MLIKTKQAEATMTQAKHKAPLAADLPLYRLPLMGFAMLALLLGLWSGLLRLGWAWGGISTHLPGIHGGLMVGGFLGTLISLERAVAVDRPWAYAAPLLCGLGGLALIMGAPIWVGSLLISLGSLITLAIFRVILGMQIALFTVTISLGVVLWAVGNLLWLAGWAIPQVVFWWAGFLVFTIAGERLELSRLLRLSRPVQGLFLASAGVLLGGLLLSLLDHNLGSRVIGGGMVALSLWLLRFDIARRRIKAGGLTRFIALCLIPGYLWLGFGGALALYYGGLWAGPFYDALLHAIFLGFVFSMIFGHAPIIFPAVLGLPIEYTPRLYLPLILLHITLILRVLGDLMLWMPIRQWGGLFNALTLLLFLAILMGQVRRQGSATSVPP
ncbi:MAG: hypothetical protein KF893_21080 [Caldilineaceae bacterium]|nr:hypothetical protein [Caldilineaceae bacterium]